MQSPVDWEVEVQPPRLDEMGVGQEAIFTVGFSPPSSASLGDYDIRVRSEADSGTRTIDAEEKIVRVSLVEPVRVWQSVLLVTLLLTLLVGVVVAGVKITRR